MRWNITKKHLLSRIFINNFYQEGDFLLIEFKINFIIFYTVESLLTRNMFIIGLWYL